MQLLTSTRGLFFIASPPFGSLDAPLVSSEDEIASDLVMMKPHSDYHAHLFAFNQPQEMAS